MIFFFLTGVVNLFWKWQNLVTKLVVTLYYNLIQYIFLLEINFGKFTKCPEYPQCLQNI